MRLNNVWACEFTGLEFIEWSTGDLQCSIMDLIDSMQIIY